MRILENDGETICTIVDEDKDKVGSQNINVKYNCNSNYTLSNSFTINGHVPQGGYYGKNQSL